MSQYNLTIPHLLPGQKVRDWRPLYIAATALLKEPQQIGFLPVVVDRTPADQKWAAEAAKQETLEKALDELEVRLDGKKTRFVALTDFFNLKSPKMLTPTSLSSFFFEALEAGKLADVTFDIIAVKFLEFVPGATKIFNDNEDKITPKMEEAQLIQLFDVVKEKVCKGDNHSNAISQVFHTVELEENVPKWAEQLQAEVSALKTSLNTLSSTESSATEEKAFFYRKNGKSFKKKTATPCSICKKDNHSAKNCFKRVCSKCSGVGHDADKCASRYNKNKKRA